MWLEVIFNTKYITLSICLVGVKKKKKKVRGLGIKKDFQKYLSTPFLNITKCSMHYFVMHKTTKIKKEKF